MEAIMLRSCFLVTHLREDPDGYDNVKFIGIYSTKQNAEAAIAMRSSLPGFVDHPKGWDISEYEIDQNRPWQWMEGFVDLSQD